MATQNQAAKTGYGLGFKPRGGPEMKASPIRPKNLMLMLTDACNLSCRYCYEHSAKGRHGSMSRDTLKEALALCGKSNYFHVQLTGGEPTLEPETLLWALPYIREHYPIASISLQTNGALLTPKLVQAFENYRILVGVSLDGGPDVQEQLRGQSQKTFQGMALLRKFDVPFNITAVVSEASVAGIQELPMILGAFPNANGIGLDMLLQKGAAAQFNLKPPTKHQLSEAIPALLSRLQFINSQRRIPIKLRELEQVKRAKGPSYSHPFCQACQGDSLAVGPQGDLYPCTQTYGDPNFALGKLASPNTENLMKLSHLHPEPEDCRGCHLEQRCPGLCPSRTYYNPHAARQLECHLLSSIAQQLTLPEGIAL
jgi:uncharacterized protein